MKQQRSGLLAENNSLASMTPVTAHRSRPGATRGITSQVALHALFVAYLLVCVIPIVVAISVSLSNEVTVTLEGYGLLPKDFTFDAYRFVFQDPDALLRSYITTILVTAVGTVLTLIVTSTFAYPLSRTKLKYRGFFMMLMLVTFLFRGGLVPTYVVNSQVLHINNTYWVLFLPLVFNAWYIIIMRTFFKTSIPTSLMEAAHIDGASEFTIYARIVLPLSKPVLATIGLFQTVELWNNWFQSLVFTTDEKYHMIQYFVYRMLSEADSIARMARVLGFTAERAPTETARFAMAVVAMGPILFIYPFFQKYFVKGLVIGAIKG
jgi:putative aldouronate transport system permease protein